VKDQLRIIKGEEGEKKRRRVRRNERSTKRGEGERKGKQEQEERKKEDGPTEEKEAFPLFLLWISPSVQAGNTEQSTT
jgi:hypothetical protein